MKSIKILLLLILLLLICKSYAQNIYEVQPGVKNNQIVLELSNISSSESAENVEVKLIRQSANLKFNTTEEKINNLNKGEEKEVSFNFDIDYNIGTTKSDTIEFLITDNNTINITKQFVFSYTGPKEYRLEQNYPNPFNPTTKIRYTVPASSLNPFSQGEGTLVSLKVYDILGNEVSTLVNEEKEQGYYEVEFNAEGLSSGIYFYRLQSGNYNQTRKMILLR